MESGDFDFHQDGELSFGSRLVLLGFFVLIGSLGFGINYYLLQSRNWFYPEVSLAAGGAIIFGIYMAFFNGDGKFTKARLAALIFLFLLGILLGFAFNYHFTGALM